MLAWGQEGEEAGEKGVVLATSRGEDLYHALYRRDQHLQTGGQQERHSVGRRLCDLIIL